MSLCCCGWWDFSCPTGRIKPLDLAWAPLAEQQETWNYLRDHGNISVETIILTGFVEKRDIFGISGCGHWWSCATSLLLELINCLMKIIWFYIPGIEIPKSTPEKYLGFLSWCVRVLRNNMGLLKHQCSTGVSSKRLIIIQLIFWGWFHFSPPGTSSLGEQ